MQIWANQLSNLTDARYFAAWNAAYISFQLDPNAEGFLPANVAEGIRGWVAGPKIVGSFGLSQTPDEIMATAELLRLDAVQVSHFYDITTLSGVDIIVAISLDQHTAADELAAILMRNAPFAHSFVFDFTKNNLTLAQIQYGEPVAWEVLHSLLTQYPIWLFFNIAPENIAALRELPLAGIVLQGGEEERVGVKDFEALDEVLEAMEVLG
jgi:phosphoribosylanthranilate isomerase